MRRSKSHSSRAWNSWIWASLLVKKKNMFFWNCYEAQKFKHFFPKGLWPVVSYARHPLEARNITFWWLTFLVSMEIRQDSSEVENPPAGGSLQTVDFGVLVRVLEIWGHFLLGRALLFVRCELRSGLVVVDSDYLLLCPVYAGWKVVLGIMFICLLVFFQFLNQTNQRQSSCFSTSDKHFGSLWPVVVWWV